MRIVFFSHNSKLEGAPLHLIRLAKLYVRNGHTCSLITTEEGPIAEMARALGIATYIVPNLLEKRFATSAFQSIPALSDADVFFVNTLVGYHVLPRLKKHFPRTKLVWMIHEAERPLYERIYTDLHDSHFALPDCVVFPAQAVHDVYRDKPMQKSLSISNGIDLTELDTHCADYSKAELRDHYGIPQDAIVITLVGYMSERKAQLEFIEAAIALERMFGVKVHFVIIGHYTRWHSAYRDYCIQRIVYEHAENRFSFFSPTQDPHPFYYLSDITVCPSYIEACPYVVLEAMAHGKPVVASSIYGVPEIIEDKVNGMLIIPGHTQEIIDALRTLIEEPDQRNRIGTAARKRIESVFSADIMYKQYTSIFEELISQPPRTRAQNIARRLYRIWLACGSPAPKLARFIRYHLLGFLWPKVTEAQCAVPTPHIPQSILPNARVSIVIPSHNYGKYLRDAIESALHQTVQPQEIIVVDDASTDNTALVAAEYASKGVQYIRGEWHNVGKARNTAAKLTTGEFLIFLDADDMLHPQYSACGAEVLLNNPSVGIAYPDSQFFGKSDMKTSVPETYDWELFDTQNHIFSPSMVRRTALHQVGGWAETENQHLDWLTWRRILRLGWKAKKSTGLHLHRQHDRNMFDSYKEKYPFAYRSGLCTEPTTLCLSLSGRTWMWPMTQKFLEEQTLNHQQVHLHILDTSGNADFGAQVQQWLATCDYSGYTYQTLQVGRKGLADLPRTDAVQQEVRDACATIYNTFARACSTATVCFLEDDILPPIDAYEILLSQCTPESVSVSGYYCHRGTERPIAWNYDAHGYPCDAPVGEGTAKIGGTGFGCLVMRGEYVRNTVFSSGPPLLNYDQNIFRTVSEHPNHCALIHWSLRCKHFSSPDSWS